MTISYSTHVQITVDGQNVQNSFKLHSNSLYNDELENTVSHRLINITGGEGTGHGVAAKMADIGNKFLASSKFSVLYVELKQEF